MLFCLRVSDTRPERGGVSGQLSSRTVLDRLAVLNLELHGTGLVLKNKKEGQRDENKIFVY